MSDFFEALFLGLTFASVLHGIVLCFCLIVFSLIAIMGATKAILFMAGMFGFAMIALTTVESNEDV